MPFSTPISARLPHQQGDHARHDEGPQGPHHFDRFRHRRDGQCRAGELRGGQGRHHRLLKSLAKEIGSRGVTVNVIAPGFIDTDMTKALPEDNKKAMMDADRARPLRCARRHRQCRVVPGVADGAYITGETLHVNGGMYMV
jgi:hypothetical protein